jgi:HPt (histidine-containing phosphotransfer) domain-containing protein
MQVVANKIEGATSKSHSNDALNFDELVRRCLGRIELAERLLASFDTRVPVELAEIERCINEGDAASAARLTHQLKGAAANVSAGALHSAVSQMEESARSGDLTEATVRLADVRHAWDEFQQFKASLPRRN